MAGDWSRQVLATMFSKLAAGVSNALGFLKRARSGSEHGEEEGSGERPAKRAATAPPLRVVEFKVVLVGDGGVGKTTLVKRHKSGEFQNKYVPTLGVDVNRLRFETNCGTVVFNVWDTAGQEKFGGLKDGYYLGGDCAIVMFDVTSRITYQNVPKWFADIRRVCGEVPIVLVGNKVDIKDREVKAMHITWHRSRGIQYYDLSAKSSFNFEKPFLYLARKLCDNQSLKFVGDFAGAPIVRALSSGQSAELEREQALARSVCIDDDVDPDL